MVFRCSTPLWRISPPDASPSKERGLSPAPPFAGLVRCSCAAPAVLRRSPMQRPALIFTLLFLMCATRAGLAEDVPNFNIDSICSVGRAGGAGAGERNADQGCRASETDARRQLENRWTGFKDESRRACVQQTQIGGL